MRHPALLLVLVGSLLAVSINVAKAATTAGIPTLLVALCATAGAGLVLLAKAIFTGAAIPLTSRNLTFYMAAGAVSYALPNALVFAAADHVGSGYAAALHAFVPVLTYVIAVSWGLDRLSAFRGLGLALGLVGAAIAILARLDISAPEQAWWILVALVAPVSIALGNVVRSRFWPSGTTPEALAPALLLAAGIQLGALLLVLPPTTGPPAGTGGWLFVQILVSAIFYHLYFRLQHLAGPVYLSQIGYVAAGFGLPLGALLFAEPLSAPMLGGMALVALGVLLVRPASTLPRQERSGEERTPIDSSLTTHGPCNGASE